VLRVDSQTIGFNSTKPLTRGSLWKAIEIGERVTAVVLLAVVSPILAFAALTIAFLSGRSPFIAHRRVGLRGKTLWVIKLRTMWRNGDSRGALWVERISPRLKPSAPSFKGNLVSGRFAAFCRRYSIDELPQLWHVARGEMALIGPRPITQSELDEFYGLESAIVLSSKPGLSGLWQVSGRSRLRYPQRRRLDVFMVRNWSFRLYFRILLRTIPSVLGGRDAW
jgi:exopolysaccharide production protein ExoY